MSRLEVWEHHTEWPLAGAAAVFLAAYAVPIIWPQVGPDARSTCFIGITVTWIAFGVDYLVRIVLAEDRGRFVRSNLIDLAAIALPVLRPLRLLRLVALLAILHRVGSNTLRGKVVTYVIGCTALLVLTGALAVTDAERGHPGANIANFGDGLWWAVTTMTTVGYGDRFPTTGTGRAVAVTLMVAGVALLGVVTATLASWLLEHVAAETEAEQAATRSQVDQLAAEVRSLREALESSADPHMARTHIPAD